MHRVVHLSVVRCLSITKLQGSSVHRPGTSQIIMCTNTHSDSDERLLVAMAIIDGWCKQISVYNHGIIHMLWNIRGDTKIPNCRRLNLKKRDVDLGSRPEIFFISFLLNNTYVSYIVSTLACAWRTGGGAGRGLGTTSRQISFEFLFLKTRPPKKIDAELNLTKCHLISSFRNSLTKPNIVQPLLPSVNIRQPDSVTPIDRTRTGLAPLPDSDLTLPLPSPIQREIAQIIINQRLFFSLEDNEEHAHSNLSFF